METWETVTMSRKEAPRAGLVKAALAGQLTNAQGAQDLQELSPGRLGRSGGEKFNGRCFLFGAHGSHGCPFNRSVSILPERTILRRSCPRRVSWVWV